LRSSRRASELRNGSERELRRIELVHIPFVMKRLIAGCRTVSGFLPPTIALKRSIDTL